MSATVSENSAKRIRSIWEKYEPKKPRKCSYCGRRDGHNARNCPEKNSTLVSQPTGSQFLTPSSSYHTCSLASQASAAPSTLSSPQAILKVASINLGSPIRTLRLKSPSSTSPIGTGNGDVELISEKQATQISLSSSALWPLINITKMVADGNCGFRVVARIIHGRESGWPEHQALSSLPVRLRQRSPWLGY